MRFFRISVHLSASASHSALILSLLGGVALLALGLLFEVFEGLLGFKDVLFRESRSGLHRVAQQVAQLGEGRRPHEPLQDGSCSSVSVAATTDGAAAITTAFCIL